MSKLMSIGGVCRKGPATPVLLNIFQLLGLLKLELSLFYDREPYLKPLGLAETESEGGKREITVFVEQPLALARSDRIQFQLRLH